MPHHTVSRTVVTRVAAIVGACAILALMPGTARAQNRLGGHFGFVLPLVDRFDDNTTTIADDFVIGWPMGVSIKTTDTITFDLELVPVIQNDPLHVSLTVHPGVIRKIADGWSAGLRMAFDVDRPSWGFTPLINHQLVDFGGQSVFGELVVPIRFRENSRGTTSSSIGLGLHFGVGF